MLGRLFSLALGAGLVALAVLINRPDLFGSGAPHVDLGLYETYRNMVGITIGMMGGLIFIAAMLRKGGKTAKRASYEITMDQDDAPSDLNHSRAFDLDPPAEAPRAGGGAAVAAPLW